jgi:hypothetical protein
MWWLWIVGPVAVGLLYILTGRLPDRRRSLELERWKGMWLPTSPAAGYRDGKSSKKAKGKKGKKGAPPPPPGPPEVSALPGDFVRVLDEAGGGTAVAYFELVPRLGYFAVMEADARCASDYQAVVAKLGKSAPTFTVRPLPIVEGSRVANTGVQFKKDPEFMELFLVEGADAVAIGKWLRRPIRSALMSNPNLWLFVRGRAMGVALYGIASAEEIDELLASADAIFAEVGAEGGPSLLGEDDEARAAADEDEGEGEGEDEDEDEEGDEEGEDDEGDEEGDEGDEEGDEGDEEEEAPKPKVTAKPSPAKAPSAERPAAKSSPVKTAAAMTAADTAAVKQSKPAGASPSKGSPARKP